MAHIVAALAGNPNAGKTTIFNALTGAHQHVGNWPGKTVQKRSGTLRIGGIDITLIDLPGIYSLSTYSPEEHVARDFLFQTPPDVVVNVVDAANLERNLYLTMQLLELALPMLLVLNMADVARARGTTIDLRRLSQHLGGLPVISMAANRGHGLDELKEAILAFGMVPCSQCKI